MMDALAKVKDFYMVDLRVFGWNTPSDFSSSVPTIIVWNVQRANALVGDETPNKTTGDIVVNSRCCARALIF